MTANSLHDPILHEERLQEIARLQLHKNHIDDILNTYVTKAAEELNLDIGLVSIVLDHVQKFSASHGLSGWLDEVKGTPVEWSFCANSVRTGEPFIVEDAAVNEITKNNPLVHMDNVRCYAGVPLITKNGFIVGNFCVIGVKSREFTAQEIDRLREYAAMTMDHIEARAADTY